MKEVSKNKNKKILKEKARIWRSHQLATKPNMAPLIFVRITWYSDSRSFEKAVGWVEVWWENRWKVKDEVVSNLWVTSPEGNIKFFKSLSLQFVNMKWFWYYLQYLKMK